MVPPSAKYIYEFGEPDYANEVGIYSAAITGSAGQLTPIAEPYLPPKPFVDVVSAQMDGQGRYIYVSDIDPSYTPGPPTSSIRSFDINSDDGSLTEGPEITQSDPVGSLTVVGADSGGKYIYAWSMTTTGWNLEDYAIDGTDGSLTQVAGSPYVLFTNPVPATTYADPVGLAVAPSGKFVYVALSVSNPDTQVSSELLVFSADSATGALTSVSGSPFPLGDQAVDGMVLSPDGKVLYASTISNVGVAGIVAYPVDPTSGNISSPLPFTPQASCCRALMMDPSGGYLVEFENAPQQNLNILGVPNIDIFSVDQATGALSAEQSTQGGAGLSGVIVQIP
jgi:6-phosphogluconolactonase (cycloisomerase 2 family)